MRCVLSQPLIKHLGQLSAQVLARWLRDVLAVLRRQMGAHVRHQPLYPYFPGQVLAASKAQLYLTAVIHYLTLRRLPPQRNARPALLEGEFIHRVIELGSMQEFESLLEPQVSSRTSLSEADAADVVWFVRQYRGDVFRLLPEAIALRKNRALVGGALLLHVDRCAQRDTFLQRHIETATDVLRLAAALSGGDISLATASERFTAMKRATRRLLLGLLDRAPNATEDVMRHAERWKRLAECCTPATSPTNTRRPCPPSRPRAAMIRPPRSARASGHCWPGARSPRSGCTRQCADAAQPRSVRRRFDERSSHRISFPENAERTAGAPPSPPPLPPSRAATRSASRSCACTALTSSGRSRPRCTTTPPWWSTATPASATARSGLATEASAMGAKGSRRPWRLDAEHVQRGPITSEMHSPLRATKLAPVVAHPP